MFRALVTDDDELARISLRSSLADLQDLVIGGEFGTPLSIGGYGFFSKSQFETQGKLLQQLERINSQGKQFLSKEEWIQYDAYLIDVASFSSHTFDHVVRGDTFGILSIKKNAFLVTALFLDNGLDPLIENEEGNDMFAACKIQYQWLAGKLRSLIDQQDVFLASSLQIRGDWDRIVEAQAVVLDGLRKFPALLDKLADVLQDRLLEIDDDIKYQRRCALLKEVCVLQCGV
jgi:hypothetical protein